MKLRLTSRLSLVGLVVTSFLPACGGASSAPPLAPDVVHDAGSETFAEINPADLAELDGGAGRPVATPGRAAHDGPTEPKEECTPVGVDFEKRARPKLKDCYAQAKKKDPNVAGTTRVRVNIDTLGKVTSMKIVESTLPDSVARCMLDAVKHTPIAESSKCPGKSFTLPVTFPTPP